MYLWFKINSCGKTGMISSFILSHLSTLQKAQHPSHYLFFEMGKNEAPVLVFTARMSCLSNHGVIIETLGIIMLCLGFPK